MLQQTSLCHCVKVQCMLTTHTRSECNQRNTTCQVVEYKSHSFHFHKYHIYAKKQTKPRMGESLTFSLASLLIWSATKTIHPNILSVRNFRELVANEKMLAPYKINICQPARIRISLSPQPRFLFDTGHT